MDRPSPHGNTHAKGLIDRLDHAAQGVNAFLLILAIGLATLDFTCFCALQVKNALPSAARVSVAPPRLAQLAEPAKPIRQAAAAAALTPTGAGRTASGW
jgi:hypothetical protein